jgi:hypothetical protein
MKVRDNAQTIIANQYWLPCVAMPTSSIVPFH